MKQIKLFSMMLLLATMFLSFNACSNDDDNDNYDKNYQEIMAKYENSKFVHVNSSNESIVLTISKMYELNSETFLSITHPAFIGSSHIGYDRYKKSFYAAGTNISSPGKMDIWLLDFVDENRIKFTSTGTIFNRVK